jgi:hypothetical protein
MITLFFSVSPPKYGDITPTPIYATAVLSFEEVPPSTIDSEIAYPD